MKKIVLYTAPALLFITYQCSASLGPWMKVPKWQDCDEGSVEAAAFTADVRRSESSPLRFFCEYKKPSNCIDIPHDIIIRHVIFPDVYTFETKSGISETDAIIRRNMMRKALFIYNNFLSNLSPAQKAPLKFTVFTLLHDRETKRWQWDKNSMRKMTRIIEKLKANRPYD